MLAKDEVSKTSSSNDLLVVPRGMLGAIYGAWPFIVIPACAFFSGISWYAVAILGTGVICGALRSILWARNRRRNQVRLTDDAMVLTADGEDSTVSLLEITGIEWLFGHPSATFDRMHDYTMLTVYVGPRAEIVQLLLPRIRDQRRTLAELGHRLPSVQWSVRWPSSDGFAEWKPDRDPIPPHRFFGGRLTSKA